MQSDIWLSPKEDSNKLNCTEYGLDLEAMCPLSCVHVCESTGRETSAHKKLRAHQKRFYKKCFCTYMYFIHLVPNTDEPWQNVAQKKLYAHAVPKELEGALPCGDVVLELPSLKMKELKKESRGFILRKRSSRLMRANSTS